MVPPVPPGVGAGESGELTAQETVCPETVHPGTGLAVHPVGTETVMAKPSDASAVPGPRLVALTLMSIVSPGAL